MNKRSLDLFGAFFLFKEINDLQSVNSNKVDVPPSFRTEKTLHFHKKILSPFHNPHKTPYLYYILSD